MNKLKIIGKAGLPALAAILLLVGCGGPRTAWDAEEAIAASDRLMAESVAAAWRIDGAASPDGTAESLIRLELTTNGGAAVEAFDVTHEKLLHLIVVSKDLSYFHHIHPEHTGGGVFEIANAFPGGGEYRLIADFKPTGGDSMTKLAWVTVEGEPAPPSVSDGPAAAEGMPVDAADGVQVSLALPEDGLSAGEEATLTFSMAEEATGVPVTDLEPYLGAIGHAVVLTEDGEQYVHVHADAGQGSGPEASFEATFPKSGNYKVWGQFQRNGSVFTVSYPVSVQ